MKPRRYVVSVHGGLGVKYKVEIAESKAVPEGVVVIACQCHKFSVEGSCEHGAAAIARFKTGSVEKWSRLSRRSRRRGYLGEKEWAAFLKKYGIRAVRVPLSGGGGIPGDVLARVGEVEEKHQVKRKASGWRGLYGAIGGHDILAVRADNEPWLVVMRGEKYAEMVQVCALR